MIVSNTEAVHGENIVQVLGVVAGDTVRANSLFPGQITGWKRPSGVSTPSVQRIWAWGWKLAPYDPKVWSEATTPGTPPGSHAALESISRSSPTPKAEGYAYEWVYSECDDIGHGLPPEGLEPIVDWMLARKRDPYPKHVVCEPSRPHKRRFSRLGLERDVRVEERIEGNEVTIDVAQPVVVRLNGETVHEGVVPARLSVLLGTIAEIALHRTLAIWGPAGFLRPLSLALIVVTAASVLYYLWQRGRARLASDAA